MKDQKLDRIGVFAVFWILLWVGVVVSHVSKVSAQAKTPARFMQGSTILKPRLDTTKDTSAAKSYAGTSGPTNSTLRPMGMGNVNYGLGKDALGNPIQAPDPRWRGIANFDSYKVDDTDDVRGTRFYFRADGTMLGGSSMRMMARPLLCDSVVFDADSLSVIQLRTVSSQTRRRTAPTSADKLSVSGAFDIVSYDANTGKVTVKALFEAGTAPRTVTLITQ